MTRSSRSVEGGGRPTRRGALAGVAAGLFAGVFRTPAIAATARQVDLMPDFWRAWDKSRGLAANEVAGALIASFFQPHADVYAGAGVKFDEARVAKWITNISPHIAAMRRQSAGFRASFEAHVRHFQRTFPDFDASAAPIYLMPSLGHFDGHLQAWGKVTPLFIGVDGLVLFHGDHPDLAVLLDHETFHLYHDQKNPGLDSGDDTPLYVGLWKEGLATYVSGVLNPAASRLNVLLDDKALDAAPEAVVAKVAAELLNRLDSHADSDYDRYFHYGYVGDIPARTGYLLGLLVAKAAANGRSLPQMARLNGVDVRAIAAAQLRVLTRAPASGATK